jgi:hypothetical protein
MKLGVNGGCSSDGLSGHSIHPANVRKQWQAAAGHVGGISCAGRCAKKCRFPVESWLAELNVRPEREEMRLAHVSEGRRHPVIP